MKSLETIVDQNIETADGRFFNSGNPSTSTLGPNEIALKRLREDIEASRREAKQFQFKPFYDFSWYYETSRGRYLPDKKDGAITVVPGMPDELKKVDGWKSGMQKTEIRLDKSKAEECVYTWHVNSHGLYLAISRQITIDENGASGLIDYRQTENGRGTKAELKGEALMSLAHVARGLATIAAREQLTMLPLEYDR